jgi:hypothetical protein
MNTRKYFIGLLALLMLTTLGCGMLNTAINQVAGGAINQVAGGDNNLQKTASLWSDVPQMDGLNPSNLDSMPPFIKLAMRFILGNLGRLNPQGTDQTTGNIDWIVFTTNKTPDDVKNFYTNARMVASGWDDAGQESTCVNGSDAGYSQIGVFCAFAKQKENIQLAVIAAQDDQTKQTNVFFLRLQASATSAPTP